MTRIRLNFNNLTGQIPNLTALTNLQLLYLNDNFLTGEIRTANIPKSVGQLNLSTNRFTGQVPDFSDFTSLTILFLGTQRIEGLRADQTLIEKLPTSLTWVSLTGIHIGGPLPDFSALSGLHFLELTRTGLSGAIDPARIPTSVSYLYLRENDFSGELPDFSGLSNRIEAFLLNDNRLSGEIDLAKLPSGYIQILNLSDNEFSGELPDFSGRTETIFELHLTGNRLTGAVDAGRFHSSTRHIYIGNNRFSDELPDFSGISGLLTLDLSGNGMTGAIDVSRLPTGLFSLHLANNDFSGLVPDINAFNRLRTLDLSNNRLTGRLADLNLSRVEMRGQTITSELYLNGNMLSGEIDLTPYTGLRSLDLSDNQFTGDLSRLGRIATDVSFGGIVSNPVLKASGNMLTGELPDLSGHRSGVRVDFSDNRLTGTVPSEHLPPNLVAYRVSGNMLTGEIPAFSESSEASTVALDFSDNQFTGTLPAEHLPENLVELRVNGNMLTGNLPDFSGFIMLEILVTYPGNDFKGVVSSRTLPLDALKRLEVGHLINIPGEDPDNPDRVCADNDDAVFKAWAARDDTSFIGVYCGAAAGSSVVVRVGRIEPRVTSVSVSPDTEVRLSVNLFGRQGIHDQGLVEHASIIWSATGGTISGSGHTVLYTSPSTPGTYEVTVSIPFNQCQSETDCEATIEVRVKRPSPVSMDPVEPPTNPSSDIPAVLTDSAGGQYEVFTPVEGGSFIDGAVSLTAGPGAVPNGEIVGLRIDDAGAASNSGMTAHRYTLAGTQFRISVVDSAGASLSDYRLNSAIQVCIPLPDVLRSNISDIAMISRGADDGSLTVLSTNVVLGVGGAVSACSSLSDIPATLAVGSRGAPAAIPTAIPEPEPAPPDTGGRAPSSSGMFLWSLLIGVTLAGASLALILRRRTHRTQ